MGNLAMTFGRPKALTANVFKRAGFTFLGWALSPDASAVTFDNRQIVDLVPSGNKSMITLYAVWKSDTDADRGTMMYTAD